MDADAAVLAPLALDLADGERADLGRRPYVSAAAGLEVDVTDAEAYKAYIAANAAAFKKYGGRFLVRGGPYEVMSGESRERNVVIEFKDVDTAKACYGSPEYQHAIAERGDSAVVDVVVVGGYEGPQPADG